MSTINYEDKVGLIPKNIRKNQVWDDDMNEIKAAVNDNFRFVGDFFVPSLTGARTTFIVGDTFMGWDGNRFVAGKILDASAVLPADLDTNKVALALDNEI